MIQCTPLIMSSPLSTCRALAVTLAIQNHIDATVTVLIVNRNTSIVI